MNIAEIMEEEATFQTDRSLADIRESERHVEQMVALLSILEELETIKAHLFEVHGYPLPSEDAAEDEGADDNADA